MASTHIVERKYLRDVFPETTCGITYNYSEPTKVKQIIDWVTRRAVVLDYEHHTSMSIFVRIETIVRHANGTAPWITAGGSLVSNEVANEIRNAGIKALSTYTPFPEDKFTDTGLAVSLIEEANRHTLTFHNVITL